MKRNIFIHFCPMASGIFCDTPGAILPATHLAGRGHPSVKTQQWNCSSAPRYPFVTFP
ncbi:hypothetical protein [Klebsiella quasipneumoniae]|uniref:hypothetical protein n=1 Tax=Klebsiella quasipneumoniae TaxID=1463165 RepID=UPI00202CD197|nr:hypothetical protein [Klebsiella quasipneumoniae]URR20053.1 hypothetical protein LT990_10510 [Klebsiella quasipneumoniae]